MGSYNRTRMSFRIQEQGREPAKQVLALEAALPFGEQGYTCGDFVAQSGVHLLHLL